MADNKVVRPRSEAKARLLLRAEQLIGLGARLHEMMEDNYVPDAVCEELDQRLSHILDRANALEEEADGQCRAAAPQANAAALSIQQERDGLGKLIKLPRELRTQIWEQVEDEDICSLATLSRATNGEVLPIMMAHVELRQSGGVVEDRAVGNVVRRLATIGQLQVKTLRIIGLAPLYTSLMLASMAPTLESLAFDALLGGHRVDVGAMPLLRSLDFQLDVPLATDEREELCVATSNGVVEFDNFIPAVAQLQHLKLSFRLCFDTYDEEEDDFERMPLPLSLQPLRRHAGLKTLAVDISHRGIDPATSQLTFVDPDEHTAELPACTALAITGSSVFLSAVELSFVAQLAPNLTRLYLDVEWEGTGSAQLPPMPALRVLAITGDFAETLRGSVDLGKLDSLSLLSTNDAWHTQAFGLAAFTGALSVHYQVRLSSHAYLSGILATLAARHLSFGSLGSYKWPRLLNLPPQLQTLQLARFPHGTTIHLLRQRGKSEEKHGMNDVFVRLPALSLLITQSTLMLGGFVRLSAPDEDGYIFRWRSKDYRNSKAYNKLFGTLEAYQNNWWDD